MKDYILIEGLTLFTTIGVYEWEKTIKQKLVIDLKVSWNNTTPAKSDDVTDCFDYDKACQLIANFVTKNSFNLIERVAEEVSSLILNTFKVSQITIKVSKPDAIANANNVAVQITRTASNI